MTLSAKAIFNACKEGIGSARKRMLLAFAIRIYPDRKQVNAACGGILYRMYGNEKTVFSEPARKSVERIAQKTLRPSSPEPQPEAGFGEFLSVARHDRISPGAESENTELLG